MNRKNDAELGMMKGADGFMDDNATEIGELDAPILATYHTQLKALIGQIQDTSGLTNVKTQGITATKAQARAAATEIGVIVRDMVFNYASDHVRPNPNLPASADNPTDYAMEQLQKDMAVITEGLLGSLKDEEVIDYLQNIWTTAGDIVDVTPPVTNPLIPYGLKEDVEDPVTHAITEPGTLTQLETAINIYAALTTSPRQAISNRKIQNQKLAGLYLQGNTLLIKMDNSFRLAKAKNPELYQGWVNIRIVILLSFATQIVGTVSKVTNLETQTTAVALGARILVTAESYQTEISGQRVTVTPDPVELRIGSDGKYSVPTPKLVPLYTVKCTLPGYEDVIKTELRVKKGKKLEINFMLLPVQPAEPAS